jgi:hypothetical protein
LDKNYCMDMVWHNLIGVEFYSSNEIRDFDECIFYHFSGLV